MNSPRLCDCGKPTPGPWSASCPECWETYLRCLRYQTGRRVESPEAEQDDDFAHEQSHGPEIFRSPTEE